MNGGDDHEGNTMDDEMSLEQTGGFVVTNNELDNKEGNTVGGGLKKKRKTKKSKAKKSKAKKSKAKKSKKRSLKKKRKYHGGFSAKNAAVATLLAGKYLLSKKKGKKGKKSKKKL